MFDSIHKVVCHAIQRIFLCCPNPTVIIYAVPEDGFPFRFLRYTDCPCSSHTVSPSLCWLQSQAPEASLPSIGAGSG